MKTYKQLTREQQYQIYTLLEGKHTQSEIADIVKVHKLIYAFKDGIMNKLNPRFQ